MQALCKQHIIDLGADPDSPVIPKQVRGQCEVEGCDNSGKHLVEVDRRKGERRVAELNILYLKNDRRLVDRRKK
jgi:hypothetical protein